MLLVSEKFLTFSTKYDMLTAPITTAKFRSRVLDILREYFCGGILSCAISSLTAEDSDLYPGEETTSIIAVTSPWIDLCSPDPAIFDVSKQVLDLEIAYAAFCGIGNIIISGPRQNAEAGASYLSQFAYTVKDALDIGNFYQLQVRLPMRDDAQREISPAKTVEDETMDGDQVIAPETVTNAASKWKIGSAGSLADYQRPEFKDPGLPPGSRRGDIFATWDTWNIIRSVCGYSTRLTVALDIPKALPPAALQSRWFSEPLRILFIGGRVFSKNKAGFPALSIGHQALISHYMRVKQPPWLLLSDADHFSNPGSQNGQETQSWDVFSDGPAFPSLAESSSHDFNQSGAERSDLTIHIDYMRHFQRKQEPLTAIEQYSSGYQDYLQSPLQPLADNLESVTYEVFEKDPVKYDQYEKAISAALEDWISKKKPRHRKDRVVVAVVGAGRGPLVTRALQASEKVKVEIELWAVEKNPNAFVLLQRHNKESWKGRVNLIHSDMRSWTGPATEGPATTGPARRNTYSIDILVSELLGSFADNELSPECLDAVTPLLTPNHGISIPCSYTSYFTPIATPKIHADLLARSSTDTAAQHMPWVTMLHSFDFLSTTLAVATPKVQISQTVRSTNPLVRCTWSFEHGPPNTAGGTMANSNKRQCRLTFPIQDRAVCHGFAGYFEAKLYSGVELSTNPTTMQDKSPDMTSWFPIFFPLKVTDRKDCSSRIHKLTARQTPLYVPDNAELAVTIRRCTDERKVWYEWMAEAWSWSWMIISKEQKKIRVGMSDIMTSKANGCLI